MKKYNLNDILKEIPENITNAKDRIYATHFIGSEKDFLLPKVYIDSLVLTKCTDIKRIVFGNRRMFQLFDLKEKFFENSFSNQGYIRMLLIDNKVFFKLGEYFYSSSDKSVISLFDEYYKQVKDKDSEDIIKKIKKMVI